MTRFLQFAFMMALLALTVLLALLLEADGLRSLGLDPPVGMQFKRSVAAGDQTDATYQAHVDALHRCWEKKVRITARLLAGQLTLFEAAALFRQTTQAETPHLYELETCPQLGSPGATPEERYCWQVLNWGRAALHNRSPALAAEWYCQHEDELRRHLEQYGKVVLPELVDMP